MARKIKPSRRSLPFQEWPENDTHAWIQAIQSGDILDGQGPAAHWARRTKETNIQHYGRWLGWLTWQRILAPNTRPSDRVTPKLVCQYIVHLREIVAPRTVLSMIVGLKVTINAMTPNIEWRWLQDVCNRIQLTATSIRNKRLLVRSSEEVFLAALKELKQTRHDTPDLKGAIAFRDALMLALLCARPLRVKNMTAIKIDHHLFHHNDTWHLTFTADEVKNSQHLDYTVPSSLTSSLDHYLAIARPVFPMASTSQCLWLNQCGSKLGRQFVYLRIIKLTKRLFGSPINPHLLRDCAATTLAIEAPEIIEIARPLLGHRRAETTEKYYIQADQLTASRKLNDILSQLKSLDTEN